MASTPTNESEAASFFQSRGAWMADATMIQADRRPIADHDVEQLALLRQIEHLTLGETAITDGGSAVLQGFEPLLSSLINLGGIAFRVSPDPGSWHELNCGRGKPYAAAGSFCVRI
jgi:hypothetical protein